MEFTIVKHNAALNGFNEWELNDKAAVAIVAQAVWGMARNLCPDRERASIAVVAALIILFSTWSVAQIGAFADPIWIMASSPYPVNIQSCSLAM